jgi:hypothetical protein
MINNNNIKNPVEELIQKNIDLTKKNFSCTIWYQKILILHIKND